MDNCQNISKFFDFHSDCIGLGFALYSGSGCCGDVDGGHKRVSVAAIAERVTRNGRTAVYLCGVVSGRVSLAHSGVEQVESVPSVGEQGLGCRTAPMMSAVPRGPARMGRAQASAPCCPSRSMGSSNGCTAKPSGLLARECRSVSRPCRSGQGGCPYTDAAQ